ncbi:MAG: zinc ribbon domain-containing protein [Christensenellaceae bacterium]|nr:zinc ribbon domain-containing protein [Christensenellaceae bacterium]
MFFFGIFGTGEDKKEIKVFTNVICPKCGVYTRARLVMYYRYFHFFFIPLFKFGKEYVLLLDCRCPHYDVDPQYFEELKNSDRIDFSRVTASGAYRRADICPNCGGDLNGGFSYCPYCGKKL